MKRNILYWIIAFVVTIASAIFQRITGPTYPTKGTVVLGGKEYRYSFPTSHESSSDCELEVKTHGNNLSGMIAWRRFGTNDFWTVQPMQFDEGSLHASLPHQPPAGKLEYFAIIRQDSLNTMMPSRIPAVIRFKGSVPPGILLVHIIAMFAGMLFSTRAGISAAVNESSMNGLTYWATGCLVMGGLMLGPLVQKYAFGGFWTGWPFGNDLTDNKTVVAVAMWIVSTFLIRLKKGPRKLIIWSAVITLAVYMIPHSLFGSDLNYSGTAH
ncbi:MAG TPA: hypothetical protein VIS48_08980 [Candidatus Kryptonia bacterium]